MISLTSIRTMIGLGAATLALGLATQPATAQEAPCSLDTLAGDWVFYTGVGRQSLFPEGGAPTAIGTQTIGADGTIEGIFDVTFENTMHIPDIPYTGTIAIGSDCRGETTFVTGAGSSRTDSLVVVSADEIRGMSQDTSNLWTYTVRRIIRDPDPHSIATKIDAIMRRLGLFVPAAPKQD